MSVSGGTLLAASPVLALLLGGLSIVPFVAAWPLLVAGSLLSARERRFFPIPPKRRRRRNPRMILAGRLVGTAGCLLVAGPAAALALTTWRPEPWLFLVLFALGGSLMCAGLWVAIRGGHVPAVDGIA